MIYSTMFAVSVRVCVCINLSFFDQKEEKNVFLAPEKYAIRWNELSML